MNNRTTKNLMIVITYTVVLILIIINFKPIIQYIWRLVVLLKPLFIGIAIAFILNKPSIYVEKFFLDKLFKENIFKTRYFMNKRKALARGFSIITVYLFVLLLFTILVSIIIPQLSESVHVFISNIGTYLNNLQSIVDEATNFLGSERIDLSSLGTLIFEYVNKLGSSLTGLLSQIITITTGVISFIVTLLISIVFSIYLLSGKEKLLAQCKSVMITYLPGKFFRNVSYVNHVVTDTFHKYVVGQLTEAAILGSLCFVGMIIFRFQYALLISVLIGITALVPVAGAYIGGFVSFMLLLMISPQKAIWFLIFLLILQQFEGNIIYPRVVGNSLGLPGIWVLLSITVGGGIAGPVGILFGVPIATVIYIIIKNDIDKRSDEKLSSNDGKYKNKDKT